MAMFYFQILSKSNKDLFPFLNCSFCIIHTRKAELRRAVEERRKRRHHEGDGEESLYDGDREKRRRTSSSNSQKSDKLDNHSSGIECACFYCFVIEVQVKSQDLR